VNDVHLQRLDQEIPVVAAGRTGQRHNALLSPVFTEVPKKRLYGMAASQRNQELGQPAAAASPLGAVPDLHTVDTFATEP
jgi:hypothetical protein